MHKTHTYIISTQWKLKLYIIQHKLMVVEIALDNNLVAFVRFIQNTLCDHMDQNPTNFVHHNPCLWIRNLVLQGNGLLQIT
jgi:hypothetical protein